MNTCVADNKVVINIQGIRYVTWGETTSIYQNSAGKYFVTVTYKGNHQTFNYMLEEDAKNLFVSIRDAMTKGKK